MNLATFVTTAGAVSAKAVVVALAVAVSAHVLLLVWLEQGIHWQFT